MSRPKLPPDFVKLCQTVTAKRPKTVINHILKHGFITTQELKDKYGCNHPPRAVRDVKEHGIPIAGCRHKRRPERVSQGIDTFQPIRTTSHCSCNQEITKRKNAI